jgi:hypothetical protein
VDLDAADQIVAIGVFTEMTSGAVNAQGPCGMLSQIREIEAEAVSLGLKRTRYAQPEFFRV